MLGTGSAGTINQHLRRWKEAQQTTQKIASKANLPEPLIAMVKNLWEGVLEQSTERFIPVEANYQQEISDLKYELEKYRANNQRWQKMFNQWQQEKNNLANELLTIEQALEFAHKENQSLNNKYDGLLQQLSEKQQRVEELHRLHQQTQVNLEHYRESAREQRLLDQQQFEREKQQLLLDTKKLNEHLIVQQVRNSELTQQNKLHERSHVELQNNIKDKKTEIELLEIKTSHLEKSAIEYQQSSQHWQAQFQDLQKLLEKKMAENVRWQSDNKSLSKELLDIRSSLTSLQDQNKLLASEKWDLAQEKAQLEGQLKHFVRTIKS